MPLQQPFRTLNPQVVLVMQGTAEFSINLINYKLQKGNLLLLPIGTLFQVHSRSVDFSLKLVDVHLPETDKLLLFVLQLRKTLLEEADFMRIDRYFDLLHDCLRSPLEISQSMNHIPHALDQQNHREYRPNAACQRKLEHGRDSSQGWLYGTGFLQPLFKKETGISPLDYRKQQLDAMLQQG